MSDEAIFAAHRFEGRTRRMRSAMDVLNLKGTESPIEATMLEALNRIPWPDGVELKQQVQIGRYRVDFMLGRRRPEGRADCLVVVECDGEAFHDVANDVRRDRFIQIHGAAVLRFTGSEIQRNPENCATEVLEWIGNAIKRTK